MSNEALVVFVIFALLALWEIEHIRKDTAYMRVMMEVQQSKWREACGEIVSISRMLQKEITDYHNRRLGLPGD
jgi:hypothetical protein